MSQLPTSGINGKRIAIIPAIFNPSLSYQENVSAQVYTDAGHDVRVFSCWHGVDKSPQTKAVDAALPYAVLRSERVLSLRKSLLPYDRKITRQIREFAPDAAFLMAPLHGLGYFWMKHLPANCRVAAGFSDIPWHRQNAGFREWFKSRWARKVFERADLILAATPQTADLLRKWGGPGIEPKLRSVGLTLDMATIVPRGTLPTEIKTFRARYKQLLTIVTKVIAHKELHLFLKHVATHLRRNPDTGLVIAGLNDNEASLQLRNTVKDLDCGAQILLHESIDSHQIGELFACSQASIWNSVSIGIYHSLASGCPALIWTEKGYAQHLVKSGQNGLWYDRWEDLPATLEQSAKEPWDRNAIKDSVAFADAHKALPALLDELLRQPTSSK